MNQELRQAAAQAKEALESIASMPVESDEWDAVEKYDECKAIAAAALSALSAVLGKGDEANEPLELSETQLFYLRQTAEVGLHTNIPRPTANVLRRLGLLEYAGRSGSGPGNSVVAWIVTDEGKRILGDANG